MAKIKKRHRETSSSVVAVKDKIPLVSVIIPMYNSAKFIPQTLESLLYQTMKDFEVVVVDDCSTDNSVEVVESFKSRFDLEGAKLHVIKFPKNTGTPGLPRNVGIQFARGKYIAFLDSDDLYTKTALEELTALAEEYETDVIRLHSHYELWGDNPKSVDDPAFTDMNELTNFSNLRLHSYARENLSAPVLEPEDIGERVRKWLSSVPNGFWKTFLFFYRRDFLVANQINFSAMTACEDMPFAFESLCLAKRYLNAPSVVYIVRPRNDSVSRNDWQPRSGDKFLAKRIRVLEEGFKALERIVTKVLFFDSHPDYRYALFDWFANHRIALTLGTYTQVPPFVLNEFVKKEFRSDDATFSAYLFNTVNIYRLQLMKLQQENIALKNELQKYRSAK